MYPFAIGVLVLICTFCGALGGMWLRRVLPAQHLDADSGSTVKVGIGLIATMTALVLGLIMGSAKSSFDATSKSVRDVAADILALDRVLARYGSETDETRALLKSLARARVDAIWPTDGRAAQLGLPDARNGEVVAAQIQALEPQGDAQVWLKARAATLTEKVLEARWLSANSGGPTVLGPFLAALMFWLSITFISFGLFAPNNFTVIGTLFVCALSVAGAVFLVLEMDGPFEGFVKASPQSLRYAFEQMNL